MGFDLGFRGLLRRGGWPLLVALLTTLVAAPARADDLGVPAEAPIEIHGFVSQGYIKTTANNYLADSERGSFEFSEIGLNFTKSITDQLRVGVQLFAQDLGPLGDYKPWLDWYYLDYSFWDWLGLRAGRTKIPFGLYNEYHDIDSARVPVLLPQSLYPADNRDWLLAQIGVELYGLVPLGGAGQLEYRLYGGTLFSEEPNPPNVLSSSFPYVFGSRVLWSPPIAGLTLGGSVQKLRLDIDSVPSAAEIQAWGDAGLLPEGFNGILKSRYPILLWVLSLEYQIDDFLLAAEHSRWRLDYETPLLMPTLRQLNEASYVMASYSVRPWFTPGIYYSLMRVDFENLGVPFTGPTTYQHDLAFTFRYDLNLHWILKLEGHYMHGTAGLDSALNGGAPLNSLKEDWGVFLIKTTAHF